MMQVLGYEKLLSYPKYRSPICSTGKIKYNLPTTRRSNEHHHPPKSSLKGSLSDSSNGDFGRILSVFFSAVTAASCNNLPPSCETVQSQCTSLCKAKVQWRAVGGDS